MKEEKNERVAKEADENKFYSQNRLEYIWCLPETISLFSSGPRTKPDGSGLTLLPKIIFSALTFLEITVISTVQGHENCEKFLVCRDVWLKRRYADPKQLFRDVFFFSLKGFCDCMGDDMYYCSFHFNVGEKFRRWKFWLNEDIFYVAVIFLELMLALM